MYDRCKVVDSDGHVMEPIDLWDRYIDAKYFDRRPIGNPDSVVGITVEDHYMPAGYARTDSRATVYEDRIQGEWRNTFQEGFDRNWSADFYLESLEKEHIDAMILNPTRALYATAVDHMDAELASAINRAYNRWLAEYCAAAPDRLIGSALVSLHDPDLAVADARYGVEQLGLKGIVIRPNMVNERQLDDPAFDEFFAAVAALDVPLASHEGTGAFLPQYGASYTSRIAQHAFSHTVEQMGAVYTFTVGGIMHRHPTLRVSICETGAGWLPYWLDRLDQHCEFLERVDHEHEVHTETADLTEFPSRYFRRQGWINTEPTEPGLRSTIDYLGAERILWSSDFPHVDSAYPGMVDNLFIAENQGLAHAEIEAYAGRNAQSLYKL